MGDREKLASWYLEKRISRRAVLKAGAALPAGAALMSATGGRLLAQDAPDFSGVTLQAWSGGTTAGPAETAAAQWKELTGGEVVVTTVPFSERALKFAGVIAAQDPSVDLVYASGQFAGQFGDRLYADLSDPMYGIDQSIYVPATLAILSSDNGLRALPVHSEMELYIYNKTMFAAAGMDPENPPDTWAELFSYADALNVDDRYGSAVPWTVSYGSGAYYLVFLNSIPGAKLLSDDRSQVLFGDDAGLAAFQAVEEGFRTNFFDPNIGPDVDDYGTGNIFNQGRTASQINFAELWSYATGSDPDNFPTTLAADEVGVTILPGLESPNSGSINGFEGFGLNKFGQQQEAALHFLNYLTQPPFQKEMNLGGSLPSSNVGVLNDPEVREVYPIGEVLAEQGQFNLDRYAAPYDWTPPFNDAVTKLYRGEIGAEQAHEEALSGVNDVVLNWLAS